jgi:membrane protease YdiL (CAAX protease family)
MGGVLGLCLPLLDSRSAVGLRVWMKEDVFSLSSVIYQFFGICFIIHLCLSIGFRGICITEIHLLYCNIFNFV